MKLTTLFQTFTIFSLLLLMTASILAQGAGFGSYTSIEYDEVTNTVMAYSQTDADYELMGDYEARVQLTVTNEYGVVVANGSGLDNGNGFANVELYFPGEIGRTYTAAGSHRAFSYLWEYDIDYPHRTIYYYDNWYFTNFESQTVYEPWYYWFYRPSYNYFRRRTQNINLGKTYDSVEVQTKNYRGSIQAQGPDINYGNRKVSLGDGVFGSRDTVSKAWAQDFPLSAPEGVVFANTVKSKLTSTQRNNREGAFADAIDFIERCGRSGGCQPRNYPFYGLNGTRVDVVINAGYNFVSSINTE